MNQSSDLAIQFYEKAIALDSGFVYAYLSIADALRNKIPLAGDGFNGLDTMRALVDHGFKLKPSSSYVHEVNFLYHFNNSGSNRSAENVAKSKEALDILFEVMPNSNLAVGYLAYYYNERAHQYDSAVYYIKKYVKQTPNYFYAWSSAGRFSSRLDQLDQAKLYYQESLDIQPDNLGSHVQLIHLNNYRGNYKESLELIQSLNKINDGAGSRLAIYTYLYMRDQDKAKNAILNALNRQKENSAGHNIVRMYYGYILW